MYDYKIWDIHHDLLQDENMNSTHVAARVMGREMRLIVGQNKMLWNRIASILNLNTEDPAKSNMARIMRDYFDNTVEENVDLLNHMKTGFAE